MAIADPPPPHSQVAEINLTTIIIGSLSLVVLRGIQIINRHPKVKPNLPIPIPEQLVVLLISILAVGFGRLDKYEGQGGGLGDC